jgi:hypothetical protein
MPNSREDRREFLKRAGNLAWAAPLILTLTAERAGAQAFSCLPSFVDCGTYDAGLGACVPTEGGIPCCNGCSVSVQVADAPCFCA